MNTSRTASAGCPRTAPRGAPSGLAHARPLRVRGRASVGVGAGGRSRERGLVLPCAHARAHFVLAGGHLQRTAREPCLRRVRILLLLLAVRLLLRGRDSPRSSTASHRASAGAVCGAGAGRLVGIARARLIHSYLLRVGMGVGRRGAHVRLLLLTFVPDRRISGLRGLVTARVQVFLRLRLVGLVACSGSLELVH